MKLLLVLNDTDEREAREMQYNARMKCPVYTTEKLDYRVWYLWVSRTLRQPLSRYYEGNQDSVGLVASFASTAGDFDRTGIDFWPFGEEAVEGGEPTSPALSFCSRAISALSFVSIVIRVIHESRCLPE